MDRDTFIRQIIATPAEDGPRLVFADWLDEQGEADRAEFIRIQIERSVLEPKLLPLVEAFETTYTKKPKPGPFAIAITMTLFESAEVKTYNEIPASPMYPLEGQRVDVRQNYGEFGFIAFRVIVEKQIFGRNREDRLYATLRIRIEEFNKNRDFTDRAKVESLREREKELLRSYRRQWCIALPLITPARILFDWFERGFVTRLECDWLEWVDHADAILAAHPITDVRLTTYPTIEFGEVGYTIRREEITNRTRRLAEYIVFDGRAYKWFTLSEVSNDLITKDDEGSLPNGPPTLERKVSEARTVPGHLKHAWPSVRFEMPPELTWHPVPPQPDYARTLLGG